MPRVLTLDDADGDATADANPDVDVLGGLLRTAAAPEDPALIQYTSGSTGQPKGVVLEHRNLLANIRAITDVFKLDETARVVSWLPPYHDMGLIGFILTPVHGAFPVRLMSPCISSRIRSPGCVRSANSASPTPADRISPTTCATGARPRPTSPDST